MIEEFLITKIDGEMNDETIKGDFICITNVKTKQVLE